jgi:hypothetical protein
MDATGPTRWEPERNHGPACGTGSATTIKPIKSAQDRRRVVNATHLAALVRAGTRRAREILVERDEVMAA